MEDIWSYYAKKLSNEQIKLPIQKSWEYIKKNNVHRGNYNAITSEGTSLTYNEIFEEWLENARVYTSLGITSSNKSRILAIAPNVISANTIDYGGNITGATVDFIDPTSSIETIKSYIQGERITDIAILDLLFLKEMCRNVESLKKEYGIRNIIVYSDKFFYKLLPFPLNLSITTSLALKKYDKHIILFNDALKNTRYQSVFYDNSPEDISLITHTSGTTTGIGKPIPITDVNRNSLVYQHDLAGLVFRPGMKMLHFIPYFAAYGSVNTVHLGMYQGMELIEIPLFKPENFSKYLIKYRPNIVLGNTPAWMSLLTDESVQKEDFSFLEIAISGGTPTNPNDEVRLNDFLIKHGAKCILTKGHGLSELCGCGSYTIDGYNNIGEMGVQLPLTTYEIRDLESNEIIPKEKYPAEGEALISSPNLSSGMLDGKTVFKTIQIGGKTFLETNDIIRINQRGTLQFIDRKDRMFTRYDAYNIYPSNIERLIKSLPEIENCVVVPFLDEVRNGMVPRIYIKFVPNVEIPNTAEYIHDLIQNMFVHPTSNEIYKANFRDIPTIWTIVNEIPKNTMGKEDIHLIKKDGLSGQDYFVEIEFDNMGVKRFNIKGDSLKKLAKIKK